MGSPCLFTRQRTLKMGYFYWLRVKNSNHLHTELSLGYPEDTKFYLESKASFIDISSIASFKDVRTHCYCASVLRTPFIKHARATSFSSARTESKTQQKHRASDLGVNLVCQYFCWVLSDPQFFLRQITSFSDSLHYTKKQKKNLCVGSFNYFS